MDISEQFIHGEFVIARKEYIAKIESNEASNCVDENDQKQIFKTNNNSAKFESIKDVKVEREEVDLKKYKCLSCDYATNKTQDITEHVRSVHLKIRDHKCNLCDFSASKKTNIRVHIETVHLNIRKHNCNMCDYAAT